MGILAEAGVTGAAAAQAVNRLLNQEMRAAIARGLSVLYCIGEKSEEQDAWQEVLGAQLDTGLAGVNKGQVAIAYEPIWSIGPGKTPADTPYIEKIARFVKQRTGGLPGCLWGRPESQQRGHAGLHRRDRRRGSSP